MSRDSGAHGVQVVGGSNLPCPTNITSTSPHLTHSPLNARSCVRWFGACFQQNEWKPLIQLAT